MGCFRYFGWERDTPVSRLSFPVIVLAIGRALIGNPSLMLLDEPSEGIQPSIVQMICTALRSFCRELGTTILFVEQNLDTILSLSDRSYVMEKGRIVASLEPGQITPGDVRRHLML
jgi:urea transport system ATP-binding protein